MNRSHSLAPYVGLLGLILALWSPLSMHAQSGWADINGDGVTDEIFQAQTFEFTTSVGAATGCNYDLNSLWTWFDAYFPAYGYWPATRLRMNVYFGSSGYCQTSYIQTVVQIFAQPGYTYRLIVDYNGGSTPPDLIGRSGTDYTGNGTLYIGQPFMPVPIAHNLRYWVVRFGQVPDEHNYYWNWEDLPNYPVGRVWDGVTIASDFPSWNWQNWPNNWSIGTVEEPADNPYAMSYMPDGDYKRYTTAERLRQMQRLQKLGQIRKMSKAVARGLSVAVLLDIWLQREIDRVRDQSEVWSYVVYERLQPSTGKIYTGQATGPGDPLTVLARRMSDPDHVWKTAVQGYDSARLNAYIGTIGRSFYGAAAVWGREQQVMDYNGGAISDRGGEYVPGYGGRTRASNKIRSVAKDNDVGYPLWLTSNNAFGNVWEYTGNEDTKVFNVALQPDKPIVFGPGSVTPYFFPN